MFTDNVGNSLGTGNVKYLVHYMELRSPFNHRSFLSPNTKFLAGLGPYWSYAVGGYEKISEGNIYANQKKKIEFGEDGHKRFDLGITAELGLVLINWLSLGVSTDFGLIKVIDIRGGTNRNNSFSFTLGYLFYRQYKHNTKNF